MKRNFLIILSLIFLLSACSNARPKSVSQKIWDGGIQYTIYLNKVMQKKEDVADGFDDTFLNFIHENGAKASKDELKILDNVRLLNVHFLESKMSKMLNDPKSEKKAINEFDKCYGKLEDTFGSSNLKEENLKMSFINSELENTANTQLEKDKEEQAKFIESSGATLTAKEVQYDTANNLNKKFFVEGNIELCDYYNYGYTNSSKFFCGKLTPTDGGDDWYLYFNREDFHTLYDGLINSRYTFVRTADIVPSQVYESGQGNMAMVTRVAWK